MVLLKSQMTMLGSQPTYKTDRSLIDLISYFNVYFFLKGT